MKPSLRIAVLCLALCGAIVRAESTTNSGTGLQIAVAGDIVGTFGGTSDNYLSPREAEVLFFAPTDYLFDGLASMAAHDEGKQIVFELHELAISSSRLIPRSRFRVGQFFLGFGRLNQFHRHDWPFTTAPKVHAEFFDDEGLLDTGLEYSYLLPLPFYLDLTFGLTNGWTFGHAHNRGTKPKFPTHYLRAVTYNSFGAGSGLQTGLNYVGRRDDQGTYSAFFGLDLTAKWRDAQLLNFLVQSEVWLRSLSPPGGESEKTLGFYVYPQYGIDPQWSVGLRLDGYTVLGLKDAVGNKIGNFDYALVPAVTFKASEFSTIRLSYNRKGTFFAGQHTGEQHYFEVQGVFIIGAHPAHDF